MTIARKKNRNENKIELFHNLLLSLHQLTGFNSVSPEFFSKRPQRQNLINHPRYSAHPSQTLDDNFYSAKLIILRLAQGMHHSAQLIT
jgi:hypothetical protein